MGFKLKFNKLKAASKKDSGKSTYSNLMYSLKREKVRTGKPKMPKVGSMRAIIK